MSMPELRPRKDAEPDNQPQHTDVPDEEDVLYQPVKKRSFLRPEWILGLIALLSAAALVGMLVLCLPYMDPRAEDPQSISRHAQAEEDLPPEHPEEDATQPQEEAPAPAPAPAPSTVDFTGSWRAYDSNDYGDVVLDPTFGADGSAEYCCGYRDSEYLSLFRGTWYTITENGQYPAGSIVLEMRDDFYGDDFFGVFTVTADSGTITLTHVSGDTLIAGSEGQSITFSPYTN